MYKMFWKFKSESHSLLSQEHRNGKETTEGNRRGELQQKFQVLFRGSDSATSFSKRQTNRGSLFHKKKLTPRFTLMITILKWTLRASSNSAVLLHVAPSHPSLRKQVCTFFSFFEYPMHSPCLLSQVMTQLLFSLRKQKESKRVLAHAPTTYLLTYGNVCLILCHPSFGDG